MDWSKTAVQASAAEAKPPNGPEADALALAVAVGSEEADGVLEPCADALLDGPVQPDRARLPDKARAPMTATFR